MRSIKFYLAVALFFSVLAGPALRGQTAAPAGTLHPGATDTTNTALVPVPWLEHDSYDWYQRHQDALEAKKMMDPQVVLIGDSITHFWGGLPKASHSSGPKSWDEVFGSMPTLNLGFGWDRIQNVLWRLDHDELRGLHPRFVIINIGTNNLAGTSHARANSPEEIAAGVLAIVDEVRAESPDSEVIVMGIFPRGNLASDSRRPLISRVNDLLSTDLRGRDKVQFLDIGRQFLDANGTLSNQMMGDYTHPTESGYHIWARALIAAGVKRNGVTGSASTAPAPAPHRDVLAALKKDDVILFQGDSITDGGRARTGNDYNHTMGQDYAYILSARIGYLFPERNLTFLNRGIGGNQVTNLAARWQTDTIAPEPNLVSIMIGINDAMFAKDSDAMGYEQTYDKLIADTQAALPGVKIVLIEPFLMPVGKYKDGYPKFLGDVKKRQDAVGRLAAKYNLPLVHMQKAMDDACRRAPADYWSWDGVHPTYAGHGMLAEEWLKTVNQAWQ